QVGFRHGRSLCPSRTEPSDLRRGGTDHFAGGGREVGEVGRRGRRHRTFFPTFAPRPAPSEEERTTESPRTPRRHPKKGRREEERRRSLLCLCLLCVLCDSVVRTLPRWLVGLRRPAPEC